MTRDAELRRVYGDHINAVFAFFASVVERHTAEDLTASTFERVIRAWDGFDPRRGSERAWVMTIAHNLLNDHFRRRRFRRAASLDEHPFLADFLTTEGDPMDQRLQRDELRAWLACLNQRDRTAIALRYGADLTAADIGAVLGLTPSTAHQVISRALQRLRREAERTAAPAASPTGRDR
ncbi:sigma-70 family RNA polymerase sigma factor [Solirubrobacter sp. CPCC 204708]|uniref:Sigma-70 family RNA polymerase sigma factor n=1 Tax=Solirubrobacter deserti TaxID=2282478 RepID=A0ABT4RU49_9ACTN|nr:sigma-70 family RNA polymerase sigma factor [Solirubrobacter deserti]MBE2314497.1 sigma-70 family RNA polymerase sigma factor [Solirubrobacter deserti]MDA0142104.1 sigma-70 family RNA polymerase sigma factor [Solirubrobacter deserti]